MQKIYIVWSSNLKNFHSQEKIWTRFLSHHWFVKVNGFLKWRWSQPKGLTHCFMDLDVSTFLLSWGFMSKFGLFSCLLRLTFKSLIFNFCRRHGWWKLRYPRVVFWYTTTISSWYIHAVLPHENKPWHRRSVSQQKLIWQIRKYL